MTVRNVFDFDGVITAGLNPGPQDIVITGRTIDDAQFVLNHLRQKNLSVPVYFYPGTMQHRGRGTITCRENSGKHKAETILKLVRQGVMIGKIFEDDPVQIKQMELAFSSFLEYNWLSACVIHIHDRAKPLSEY
jgi:hypothetical protein